MTITPNKHRLIAKCLFNYEDHQIAKRILDMFLIYNYLLIIKAYKVKLLLNPNHKLNFPPKHLNLAFLGSLTCAFNAVLKAIFSLLCCLSKLPQQAMRIECNGLINPISFRPTILHCITCIAPTSFEFERPCINFQRPLLLIISILEKPIREPFNLSQQQLWLITILDFIFISIRIFPPFSIPTFSISKSTNFISLLFPLTLLHFNGSKI